MTKPTSGPQRLRDAASGTLATFGCVSIVAILLASAACLDTTGPDPVLLWQGELEPVPGLPVSAAGTVAMAAGNGSTQLGIEVRDGTPGVVLGWVVRTGSCEGPGEPLAQTSAFPELTLSSAGGAAAEKEISTRVAGSGSYSGELLDEPGETGIPVACAEMVLLN